MQLLWSVVIALVFNGAEAFHTALPSTRNAPKLLSTAGPVPIETRQPLIRCMAPAIGLVAGLAAAQPAWAAVATKAGEHLHLGQKVANKIKNTGLPDAAVVVAIAAMPVLELRGAIPVGIWLGLPVSQVICP